jgi:hypothetical protein
MGEQDGGLLVRDIRTGQVQIVGAEEVGIIHSGDPETLSPALDGDRFVQQEGKSRLLEGGDLFQEVVVAKDGEAYRMK